MQKTNGWAALCAALCLATPAAAKTEEQTAQDDRIRELERKVEVLTDELQRTRTELAVPEDDELTSIFGAGPAASKVYNIAQGLSIGGYGEAIYENFVSDQGGKRDKADFLRAVLYFGYKFTDRIIFNSEIEFEHATSSSTVTSGDGSVSVEFVTLDYLLEDYANLRAGLLLVPMGFMNEIHEPPFYYGTHRPDVERQIIPSTWRENGAGVFGTLWGEEISYKAYAVNGLNAVGFSPSGLRGGRQKGNRALAEHWAFVARVDWTPLDGLLVGGSVYTGNSGQNQKVDGVSLPDTLTTIWDLHAQYHAYGLKLRGLLTGAHLRDAGDLTMALREIGEIGGTDAIGGEMLGFYVEAGYDLLPLLWSETEMAFEPFFRFEWYDTQHDTPNFTSGDKSKEITSYTTGFSFKPIPNVVVKMDYRNRDADDGDIADEFNIGIGYAF